MEELFIDMVDYDFCLKARLNKYNIVTSEKALLMHELGNIKSKKIFNKEIKYTNHSPIRRYYITRNRRILHFMYKQYFNEFLKKELTYSKKEMIKVILFEKQKIEKIKMYFKAIVDYNKWKKKYNKK